MTKSKHVPHMLSVMMAFPYCIGARDSLAAAEAMMNEHDIRHLPVEDEGDIIGIISHRDLLRAVAVGERVADQRDLEVGDLVTHRPYLVDINDPVDAVLRAMLEKRLGSVLVLKDGELVGIFTTSDALRQYALLLDEVYQPQSPDDMMA